MTNKKGFTLIETIIVFAIVIAVAAIVLRIFTQNFDAWRLGEGLTQTNSTKRVAQAMIYRELGDAGLQDDDLVGLVGLAVLDANGVEVAAGTPGTSVVFQRPQLPNVSDLPVGEEDQNDDGVVDIVDALLFFPDTLNGLLWTTPITIRLRNEDTDGDLVLDVGEDANGNGRLDRVIERIQDDQTLIIANDVIALNFTLESIQSRLLDVAITTQRRSDGPDGRVVQDTLTFSLVLVN